MKNLIVLTASLLAVTAFADIPENTIIHRGYDHTGAFIEELVEVPEGADVNAFASHLTQDPPVPITQELKDSRVGFRSAWGEDGFNLALTWTREFGEFADLFEPELIWSIVEVADTGEAVVAPAAVERRGPLAQVKYSFQERPVVSTLSTVAGVLALDYFKDGEINLFGLLGSSDNGNDTPPGGITINAGRDTVVNITQQQNSGNDSSNRPATATPFFPPPAQ